jgi:BlaI family penicillinase repressor
MARPASGHPTELELQILKILWHRSPLPVREVREGLANQGRAIAHTSVITTLNTMVGKRYLKRTKAGKAFLFVPRVSREQVSEGMLGDVVERVFDGSPSAVMVSLFHCAEIDEEELKELRRLINRKMKEQAP